MVNQNLFHDAAAPIIAGEPALPNDDARAELWDSFHSKNSEELAQHLAPMDLPPQFKQKLYDAKKASEPELAPVDKTIQAISRIKDIPPDVREMAESHPNLLKALTGAAHTSEKQATETAPKVKINVKAKPSAGGESPATPAVLAQPPRTDGQEHYPPIPEGHRRVRTSDGIHYDIPDENLDEARQRDPNLMVLNP